MLEYSKMFHLNLNVKTENQAEENHKTEKLRCPFWETAHIRTLKKSMR